MFVECEWLQVNKVRAQAQDTAVFDDMYKIYLSFLVDADV